jgi:hypothetical protein
MVRLAAPCRRCCRRALRLPGARHGDGARPAEGDRQGLLSNGFIQRARHRQPLGMGRQRAHQLGRDPAFFCGPRPSGLFFQLLLLQLGLLTGLIHLGDQRLASGHHVLREGRSTSRQRQTAIHIPLNVTDKPASSNSPHASRATRKCCPRHWRAPSRGRYVTTPARYAS